MVVISCLLELLRHGPLKTRIISSDSHCGLTNTLKFMFSSSVHPPLLPLVRCPCTFIPVGFILLMALTVGVISMLQLFRRAEHTPQSHKSLKMESRVICLYFDQLMVKNILKITNLKVRDEDIQQCADSRRG